MTSQKEQAWPPISRPQRWRNSLATDADPGARRRRSSAGSTPSAVDHEFDDVDDDRPDIYDAASGASAQRRSASVGGLPRGPRRDASDRHGSRSTAALGLAARGGKSTLRSRQRSQADRGRGKTVEDDDLLAQKKVALVRTQAAYDGVLRYASQIVLSEASVLAIIARVLKLRHQIQQTLLNEGQFTLAVSLCASLGLVDLPTSDRRLRLRKRLATVQVSLVTPAGSSVPTLLPLLFCRLQRRVYNIVSNVDLMAHYRAVMVSCWSSGCMAFDFESLHNGGVFGTLCSLLPRMLTCRTGRGAFPRFWSACTGPMRCWPIHSRFRCANGNISSAFEVYERCSCQPSAAASPFLQTCPASDRCGRVH